MDQEQFRQITRRGLAKATGAVVTAGALARLERAELALAKGRGGDRPAANRRKPKPTRPYTMLVYGKASGPIYDELKKTYRMVRYTGTQDPGKYQGVLVDHTYQTVESLSRTRLFKTAYSKGVRLFMLNTEPQLMREVFARQFGGIRSDAMPGFILDRRRSGNNIRGATFGTAWPITPDRLARGGRQGFRHAATDPSHGPRAFREAFDLWMQVANDDPATRASTGATQPGGTAPQWGTGFVGQTSQQPVTSVPVEAWGNNNTPVYGMPTFGADSNWVDAMCPGFDGFSNACFQDNSQWDETTYWMVVWEYYGTQSSWTPTPTTSNNAVVFVQSVAAGLWVDGTVVPPVAPTLDPASACAAPPAPTNGQDLSLWVSAYMSGGPSGTNGCLAQSSGTVDLCYIPADGPGDLYCDSDTGSGQWGVGVRPVPAVVGYNMYLGYETTLNPTGGAPTLDFQAVYPCNQDSITTLTSGSSHTQGFTIGAEMGYADGGPAATLNAGYEDEWSVDSGSSYDVPQWAFLTSSSPAGTAWQVPEGDGNYNTWASYDSSAPPCTSNCQLTTDASDLNDLQCGTNAVTGQAYYVGATNGQGSIDVTTTFTYWAGTTSDVVNLMLWDQPKASTQFPTGLYQSVAGGTYPITWTLATDSRQINPVQAPSTFSASWSDPVVVSPPNATQVLQSTLTIDTSAASAYDWSVSLLLAVGLNTENPGALNDLVTVPANGVQVNGTAVSSGLGDPIPVPAGGTLTFEVQFETISGVPYYATAWVTSSNPAESLSAAWAQVPVSYQPVTSAEGGRRSLKDRLTRKRRR